MAFSRRRGEHGLTLIELLIAITIEAVILGALTMAFLGVMRGTKNVNESLNRSSDVWIAANYIIADAHNSSGPETSLSDTASCPDLSPPVAGTQTPVVRFMWSSTGSAGGTTANIVNYVLVQNSLLRRQCRGGTLVSDAVVASSIASVTVACSPIADCSGTPSSITATVNEVTDSSGSVYQYKLTGAFRKLNGTGPPVPSGPLQSVILLGTGGSCTPGTTGISVTGAANMTVYGNAFVNTTDGATCKAMTVGGSGTFQAGTLKFLQGGSCVSTTNGLPCPPSTTYTPALTDPYASLTAPSTSGMPVQTGCSGPQASQTASPGFYTTGLTLAGGNTCTLASGVYVIQGGIDLSHGAVLKTGAGGVLIYLTTGQFSVAGGSSITLTAMTSGAYSGLAFWQAAADTNPISWSHGGSITINGALYASKAELDAVGNAENPIVGSLVVQSIILTNSGGITVGFPLSITAPTSLPTWTAGLAYPSTASDANGGGGVYTWSASGLPTGMTINSTSGVISGTPAASGSFSVTITLNDAAGDAADTSVLPLTITPVPAVTSVALTNGGTAGTIDKGDTISIVFNVPMSVAGFCSGAGVWSGDDTDQSITGNNVVSVVVTNGATSDSIAVTTASGCTFNFGGINMNSAAYVTSTATFNGSGTNKSTIAWTASSRTLTITLGALASGAVVNVPGNTSPTYTPDPANEDPRGVDISNSPFTLSPAAKRF